MDLKIVQENVYQIFVEFDRICRKYNIEYSMEGGTLLGAVKYQNFVPWDDDIDVIMRREDYEKFLTLAPTELNEKYFLQTSQTSKEFPLNYAKICLNGTKICDYEYSHLDMHHGIFMDIFPIDNTINKFKNHCRLTNIFTCAKFRKLKIKPKPKGIKSFIAKIISILPLRTLNKMILNNCIKYNKQKTEYRYEVCNANWKFSPLKTEFYDEYIELPFRDKKFKSLKEYDELLKSRFGDDYMVVLPPEDKRSRPHASNIIFEDNEKNTNFLRF